MKILGVGEILWDVFDDAERLGGASFNFAAQSRRLGHEVLFVSAVGDDERGRRALLAAEKLGLGTRFLRTVPGRPTGTVTVTLGAGGQPAFTIHRPAAYDDIAIGRRDFDELAAFDPAWIYFGTLHQMDAGARAVTRQLLEYFGDARRFYDINLRAGSYTEELLLELLPEADVAKMNEDELDAVAKMTGSSASPLEQFCREAAGRFGWDAVCVTRGERGCALLADGIYAESRGYPVDVADTVGAGDAFAAAFLHGLEQGWNAAEVADFANRVGALVAARPGALPDWTIEECRALRRG
jgi:fructokinase